MERDAAFGSAQTLLACVVAVMDKTKVGTVEQLRFSRRPWEAKTGCYLNTAPKPVDSPTEGTGITSEMSPFWEGTVFITCT